MLPVYYTQFHFLHFFIIIIYYYKRGLIKMSEGIRSEQVGAKVTPYTKERIAVYKKETGKSLADVIEMVYMIFSCGIDERVLFKVENLEEQINLLQNFAEKTQKITEETLNIMKAKEETLNKMRRQIKKEENTSKEDDLKKTLKSFIEIRDQHIDSFGNYKPHFDVERAGKNICEINNVSYNDLEKLLGVMETGVGLEYILAHDLVEFGVDV